MGPRLVDTHDLVSARLREAGQLYTKGRRELVELLLRAGRPATVPNSECRLWGLGSLVGVDTTDNGQGSVPCQSLNLN